MSNPAKLGVVCYPTVGGSGVVATEVARYAADHGHEVHLLSYARPTRLPPNTSSVIFHQVQVSAYPLFRYPPYDLALATKMLEVREEAGVELFHVHYAIPHAISAFLARSMGPKDLKFVTTLHGTDITIVGADQAYARPTAFSIEQSNAVTAVSDYLAAATKQVFAVEQPIEVVPNFVDTQRYKPGSHWYDRNDEERVVVHASNFRPVKRVADVVRAFRHVAKEIPARLVLVGDGPDREHALAVAEDLGILDHVHHAGTSTAMEATLAEADLFMMASETESFGLSILEAMSCGVPCVSTDVGGVSELMGDTGALAPLGDTKKLGAEALRLLRTDDVHRREGERCRQRAVEHFDQEKVVPQYFEIYRRVLAGG